MYCNYNSIVDAKILEMISENGPFIHLPFRLLRSSHFFIGR